MFHCATLGKHPFYFLVYISSGTGKEIMLINLTFLKTTRYPRVTVCTYDALLFARVRPPARI